MAVICQLILGILSGIFFWKRTIYDWDAAGYALILYFIIQCTSSGMTTHRKRRLAQESLPLHENQCMYCCVPSKGKVALTRLGWLLGRNGNSNERWMECGDKNPFFNTCI